MQMISPCHSQLYTRVSWVAETRFNMSKVTVNHEVAALNEGQASSALWASMEIAVDPSYLPITSG